MAKTNALGAPFAGHCNWCKQTLEEGKFEQYGDNYDICDACTLKFAQRASVLIQSNLQLAEKAEQKIEAQVQNSESE